LVAQQQEGNIMTTSATAVATPSDREIRVERIFDAPIQRVWQAFSVAELLAQWWGRGNKLVVEKFEFEKGGHWRFVEHGPEGISGFEGRFREIVPQKKIAMTFEWDGMPGYVSIDEATFEDVNGKTKVTSTTLFHTTEERDGMMKAGMEQGLNQSYEALDKLLATLS
jgi:uncharacterized protein YndB with AHSA1/START domain